MKIKPFVLILILVLFLQSCSSTKVLSAWKAEQETIDKFREKNILVIARTADDHARIAFEEAIKLQLEAKGLKATESFKKFPKIHNEREMTEERLAMVLSILDSEGYNGVVITVIKTKNNIQRPLAVGFMWVPTVVATLGIMVVLIITMHNHTHMVLIIIHSGGTFPLRHQPAPILTISWKQLHII